MSIRRCARKVAPAKCRNSLLVDFFSPTRVAERVAEVLDGGDRWRDLRRAARRTILTRYELRDCLQRQVRLIEDVAARRPPRADAKRTR